jgi:hypothetical protein
MYMTCSTLGGEDESRVIWENSKEINHWEDRYRWEVNIKLILEK